MIKNYLKAVGMIALCCWTASAMAQQYRVNLQTNASATAIYSGVVSTNYTVFTLAAGRVANRVSIQNQGATWLKYKFGAVTGGTNAFAGCQMLAPQGTVGDSAVYEHVLPSGQLVVSAQSTNLATGGTLGVEVLGQ